MGAEKGGPAYKDIFETEGPDRGRVKDVDVAHKMAKTENLGHIEEGHSDKVKAGFESLAENVAAKEVRKRVIETGADGLKTEEDLNNYMDNIGFEQEAAEKEYREFQSQVDKEEIAKLRAQLNSEKQN